MAVDPGFVFIMFIGLIVSMCLAAMFGIFLALLSITTPAWTFFKAKIKHKPLLAARRRDRKIDIHIATSYIEGLAVSSVYNSGYIIDPDSVYTEKKSNVPILPVNAEVGITLSPKVLRMIDGLKRMGYTNIEEAMNANMLYGECECGYEGMMDYATNEKGEALITDGKEGKALTLVCPYNTEVKDVLEKEDTKAAEGGGVHKVEEPRDNEKGLPDTGAHDDV
jgi:hypothetical protein